MIENILDDYDAAYGLKSVRFRYFNVAGADAHSRIGEWHEPETHLIPNILKSTFSSEKIFELYGDDYDTRDGTCIRDYVNVEDLAQAHILGLQYLQDGGNSDFFNLGTEEGSSVKEILTLCEQIVGQEIPVKVFPPRSGDTSILLADSTKVRAALRWSPQKTLEDSIRSAYEWEKKLQKWSLINA
jgi:UDP-glucose 4-epimerase